MYSVFAQLHKAPFKSVLAKVAPEIELFLANQKYGKIIDAKLIYKEFK